jgi:diguanylate cyclase (GGDEF)-like protein
MSQTTLSMHESLRQLLVAARQNSDCSILLPVIESIFNQIDTVDGTAEETYRQVIKQLARIGLESNLLSELGQKQFEWMIQLSDSGHDANVLEAMSQQLTTAIYREALPVNSTASSDTPPTEDIQQVDDEIIIDDKTAFKELSPNIAPTDTPTDTRVEEIAQFEVQIDQDHGLNEEIDNLKSSLHEQIDLTRKQFSDFENKMLSLASDASLASSPDEIKAVKSRLTNSIHNLLSDQSALNENIQAIGSEIEQLGSQCTNLNHELGLVKQLSSTDDLTRLANRRAFMKILDNEAGRVQRHGYPLCVAMLELDLFLEIIDSYGQAIGDRVIQFFSKDVLSVFRNYDLVARIDEARFAVLLPHSDLQDADQAINKVLQKAFESRLMISENNKVINMPTFSAGIAQYREGESIESLINRAENAMLSATSQGRNQVVLDSAAQTA